MAHYTSPELNKLMMGGQDNYFWFGGVLYHPGFHTHTHIYSFEICFFSWGILDTLYSKFKLSSNVIRKLIKSAPMVSAFWAKNHCFYFQFQNVIFFFFFWVKFSNHAFGLVNVIFFGVTILNCNKMQNKIITYFYRVTLIGTLKKLLTKLIIWSFFHQIFLKITHNPMHLGHSLTFFFFLYHIVSKSWTKFIISLIDSLENN